MVACLEDNHNFVIAKTKHMRLLNQWRTSVKIIGGDETEPSKVAHIISRKFATEFLGNLGNTFVISAQKQVVYKKKFFIEIESHSSTKIGNSSHSSTKIGCIPPSPPGFTPLFWIQECYTYNCRVSLSMSVAFFSEALRLVYERACALSFLRSKLFPKSSPNPIEQRWSPRGRPWLRGRPRGHIFKSLASNSKSLALASNPQVLKNCPVLGSRSALFFVPLQTPETSQKICKDFFCFLPLEITWKMFLLLLLMSNGPSESATVS